jgi:hypothetical protein
MTGFANGMVTRGFAPPLLAVDLASDVPAGTSGEPSGPAGGDACGQTPAGRLGSLPAPPAVTAPARPPAARPARPRGASRAARPAVPRHRRRRLLRTATGQPRRRHGAAGGHADHVAAVDGCAIRYCRRSAAGPWSAACRRAARLPLTADRGEKMGAMNLLPGAAAYGVIALLAQSGWAGELIGIDPGTAASVAVTPPEPSPTASPRPPESSRPRRRSSSTRRWSG